MIVCTGCGSGCRSWIGDRPEKWHRVKCCGCGSEAIYRKVDGRIVAEVV